MEYQSIKYNNQWAQLLLLKLGALIKKKHDRGVVCFLQERIHLKE